MSSQETTVIEPDMIRRITRSEYREMGRAGLFDNERVELLYGQLVLMSPLDPAHDESSWTLTEALRSQLGKRSGTAEPQLRRIERFGTLAGRPFRA